MSHLIPSDHDDTGTADDLVCRAVGMAYGSSKISSTVSAGAVGASALGGAQPEGLGTRSGGGSCPYRFRCVVCDHFRTDVSYLPDLKAYLHDLLQDRERVLAAVDLEQWAKTEAMPSHAEIRRLQDLIHRVEQHLGELAPEQRAEIDNATAVVRRARQVVNLGVPRVRPSNPDLRLERP
ncbi:hypothetical protein H4696_000278 [Amycolatopsis lexingtonensis]|uniref:Transposase n=1 Tax=Amycolatopsis lexingtonensis TaxID=218822 RepID=A0ABR9HQH2_9PSEU|nr:hypothetical protein [Amycolatopsis lexingtonensis]MBE1493178.1 hypothetical protein [Amycolatopsis lexingtonensis]